MKIYKSIKWRLQLWYGLILVVVLAGFGLTVPPGRADGVVRDGGAAGAGDVRATGAGLGAGFGSGFGSGSAAATGVSF